MQTSNHHVEVEGAVFTIWTTYYPSSGALAVILNPVGETGHSPESVIISVNMDHGQDHESRSLPKTCFYVPIWRQELAPYLQACEDSPYFRHRTDLPVSHSGYVSAPVWEYVGQGLTSHFMGEDTCPACETPLDMAGSLSGGDRERPQLGDFSVCIHCATILVFDKDLKLRIANSQDMEELEPGHAAGIERIRAIIKART